MGISVSGARLSLVVGVCVLLVACGGDDGGNVSAADPTSPSPPSSPPPPDSPPSVKNSPPSIGGKPQPSVLQQTPYVFQPEATDDDGDILHFSAANVPPWAAFEPATGRLEGTPGAGDLGTYPDIMIEVTDGADDAALQPFSITVTATTGGAVELTWDAPTENTDGSALTDLAGYTIYWGTEAGELANSITIENPGIVSYVLENLVPATYYFVATAFNVDGSESEPSEMATGTIS